MRSAYAAARGSRSMAARGGPVGQQFVAVDDYDVLVYPGFLRRPVRSAARCSRRAARRASRATRHLLCAALLRRRAPGRVAITVDLSESPRRGRPADEQRAWHAGVSLTLKTTPCADGALERRRLLRAHRKGPQRQG